MEVVLYCLLASTIISIPFLVWWSRWKASHKTKNRYKEILFVLFLIKQKDTGKIHTVWFGEISGVTSPSLGNTHGRYENLAYMCPEYEYETVSGGLVYPRSMKMKDLHRDVGEWIDRYWSKRFEDKK